MILLKEGRWWSFYFGFFDVILVFDATIVVLYVKSSQIFEAHLHALFFGRSQQLMLEGIHTSIKTFTVEVHRKVLVIHLDDLYIYFLI